MRVFVALLVFFVFAVGTCYAANIDPAVLDELTTKGEADVIITLKEVVPQEGFDAFATKYEKSSLEKRRSMVMARQDGILSAVFTKGVAPDFELKYKYSVINAVSGKLTKSGFDKLKNRADVGAISLNGKVYAMLDESAPLINADDVWGLRVNGKNITGAGETVCIIDTGVDYNHTALGGCFGTGCKVLGGYDFVNNDTNPMDDHGHGTHCAGIVASTDGTYRGVAPDAKIVAIKALGADGVGEDAFVLAGINWCIDNASLFNISVISMSLGDKDEHYASNCDSAYYSYSNAINTAVNMGVMVVAASGNEYSTTGISPPACIENATSIGSSYVSTVLYCRLLLESGNTSEIEADPMLHSAVGSVSGDLIYAGLGYPENFTGQNFTGKVALIKRGGLYFYEKVQNAYEAGAVGAVIFNNGTVNIIADLQNTSEIPAVFISLANGNYLMGLLENETVSVNLSVTNESVSNFTNRNEFLDLLAPGGKTIGTGTCPDPDRICSTKRGEGFISMTGTSMATPHVAGAAALLNQYQRERNLNLTPKQIEDLLWETGAQVYDPSTTLTFSRIDVLAAIDSLGGFSATSNFSASGGIDVFSLPVSTTAESFLNQTNCTLISKYEGGIQTHIKGTPFFNFNVTPGSGYYTYCPTNGSKTITGLHVENVTVPLTAGWNLIGSVPTAITTADELRTNISATHCLAVARYTGTGFETWDGTSGVNFDMTTGKGYFVYVQNTVNWTIRP